MSSSPARPSRFPMLLLGVAAVGAFGLLLLGLERGWLSSWRDGGDSDLRVLGPVQVANGVAGSVSCPNCGTIYSVGRFPLKVDGTADSAPPAALRVTVRMDDGSFRSFAQPPGSRYAVGDRVRVVDGTMVADAI